MGNDIRRRNSVMQSITLPALALAMSFGLLAGCANPSVITLNDGREIQTLDRPDYDDESGFYEYEQIDGKPGKVNKDQVRTVREL
jgi:hypothetical protein